MPKETAAVIEQIARQYDHDPTRLMDVARAVHGRLGHLSELSIGLIAQSLGIHRAQVRDMVSFYAFFSRSPQGKNVIRVCTAVVERMQGADELIEAFEKELGVFLGETTEDGKITLEKASCIGLSDQAPSVLVNGIALTSLQPEDVPGIVAAIRAGEEIDTLPQARVRKNLRQSGPILLGPYDSGDALRKAIRKSPAEIIIELYASQVRGCGGAGFPTAAKWEKCRVSEGSAHYVICNADEGEPGTFKDRVILMDNPELMFDGMTIAGYTIGAEEGMIYLRGEYDYLRGDLERALANHRQLGLLGRNICGLEGFNFDIRIQAAAGAYICGEESALIESLEGKRGAPRDRPPFPVEKGYKEQPTLVNNVETFCCAARILENGGEWFSRLGTVESKGTKLLSISGDCQLPGVYEVEYGITVEKLLRQVGAEDAQAVQIGGPSGSCIGPKDFSRRIAFEDLATGGSIIIFGPGRDLLEYMYQFGEFFAEESCGWCVPCRVGTTLLLKEMRAVLDGHATHTELQAMQKLCGTIKTMSQCGLGQTAPNPILSTLKQFPELYEARLQSGDYFPRLDLAKAVRAGCASAGREMVQLEPHASNGNGKPCDPDPTPKSEGVQR
ncbi:NAD(P)H-dependent oxidoreductase subunit E [Novipirellula artificiosorum]|uniref:NAD-reducing hydrogenase HoxS subunit alpha n=1 Tax=Novipirellula artificiosorum TaxID=2528016 RepID=A0A5C6DEB9_9BACT|nr:NAD(P)H-dependent oxidoreductase subunit E [Novipirellula artificiosorum]TWU34264.1 NAD-reducing hydrogenase HoxS subunit alpha [Novipirellula artificiosorum]